jgi:ribonuclease Z
MNVGDSGCTNELDVFGPPGTAHILASMRSYMYRYVFIQSQIERSRQTFHRDSIKVRAMDIPILPTTPEPTAFYFDKNITAYSIPIFSTADPAPAPPEPYPQVLTPKGQKKRKRSPSPIYALKRPFDATDSKGRPVISDTMANVIRKPDFRPEDLRGKVASEWREIVIRTMFPSTNLTNVPSPVSAPPDTYIPMDKRQHTILFRPSFTNNLKVEGGRK